MKKFLTLLLSLFILINLCSCSGRSAQPPQQQGGQSQGQQQSGQKTQGKDKLDPKEGEALLDNYAKALILRDTARQRTYYSQGMRESTIDYTSQPEPHPNGYKVDKPQEKEGKLEGTIRIYSVSTGVPYFSSDEMKYTVIREKGAYVIDKLEKSKTTEISDKEGTLIMKQEGDIKGKEVLKINALPEFATPQGASFDHKFTIGKDKFGPIAGDPDGKKLAVSTWGTYPALVIVDIQKNQSKPLDIFFNENVRSIAWSNDGKFLSATMTGTGGGSAFLHIYDVEKQKIIIDPMAQSFKRDRYTINTAYWISSNELVFNVSGAAALTADEQRKLGSYKFDAKNGSLTNY